MQKELVGVVSEEINDWVVALSQRAENESAEITKLTQELHLVTNSFSWRITAPIRRAKLIARKFLRR